MNVHQLQTQVEQLEEWEQVAVSRVLMLRAKDRLALHDADAAIARIHRSVSDRIGLLIQQTVK
jgi:hypothetical protein